MPESSIAPSSMPPKWCLAACAGLLLVFMLLAWFSAVVHSPTADEPIHDLSGYVYLHQGDFRFDVDNPPLWKYWAMIPNLGVTLKPQTPGDGDDVPFLVSTKRLFQTPGNDGAAFVNRSRAAMLVIGMMLGIALAWWSWQLGGEIAAVVACALYCFDPNFLAHSPLIKADILVALLIFGTAWATWSAGKKMRWWNVLLLALLCGMAFNVKYNGLLTIFVPLVLLPIRARLVGILKTLFALLVVLFGTGVIIWACYGFRYAPSPDGSRLDIMQQIDQLKRNLFIQQNPIEPTLQQIQSVPTPLLARAALMLDEHHLLPQAWLYGLVSILRSSTTLDRQSYLLGEVSTQGWWYYFPLTILYKTPLAVLLAIALATLLQLTGSLRTEQPQIDRWTALCLIIPSAMYALAACTSNADVGVRHILPIYPPIYVCVGIIAAKTWKLRPQLMCAMAIFLALGLCAETLAAFPHYISFFNLAARPQRLHLLGDSNLDWGQDLTYVADWQRANKGTKLYLAYWGPADPRFYGIDYTNLPGGFALNHIDPPSDISAPGVVMISAMLLQGVNVPPEMHDYYAAFRRRKPDQVIGDSIYLYNWPLK